MPGIVEFPAIIQKAIEEFGHLFTTEPARRHFGEYLTGLIVAQRKSVLGIHSEFVQISDQSCLNKWLTQTEWDEEQLNKDRLKWHQLNPSTKYSKHGVIAIDNVLIDHDGKQIDDVAWYWDHADQKNKLAHDYLISNYVCNGGKHYSLNFRRFRKETDCEEIMKMLEEKPGGYQSASPNERSLADFKNHTELFIELVNEIIEEGIDGSFAFDSYFTNAQILNHLNDNERSYVGDLKFNRNIEFKGKKMSAIEFAHTIPSQARKAVEVNGEKQWSVTVSVRIPKLNHKARIVILWKRKNSPSPAKILISNRIDWEITRILRVYRRRWTGTETFHRDGKQHLGMADCQLRNGRGHTRHMYLVILAHSLLVDQLQQGRENEWGKNIAYTIGEACRGILRETLGITIDWAIDRALKDNWKHEEIIQVLGLG